jgi:serine carboxypeptidase-like clade 2
VISDEVWGNIIAHCTFGRVEGKACGEAKSSFRIGDIDRYNIYAPVCLESPNGSLHSSSYVSSAPCNNVIFSLKYLMTKLRLICFSD